MKKNLIAVLFVSLSSIFINSCKNDILNTITPLKAGEMQATVSGSSGAGNFFAADTRVIEGTSTYNIVGSEKDEKNNDSLTFTIYIPKLSTPPYTVNVSTDPTAVVTYCVVDLATQTCVNYQAKLNIGSMVVKVTDVAQNANIQGTFSGTLQATTGSGSVTISDGAFNASY